MHKKSLIVIMIFMMVFTLVPASAAADKGIDPGSNLAILVPRSVMYVGWSWTYGGDSDQSMGYTTINQAAIPGSNHGEFTANTSFIVTAKEGDNIPVNSSTFYNISHKYINLDVWNYSTGETVPSAACTAVTNFNGDLLIVDMFYSSDMNAMHQAFVNATIASGADNKASIFSADPDTGRSSAPAGFQVRDTLGESRTTTNAPFTLMFFHGLQQTGASSAGADWSQYQEIIAYVAPYI